MNNEKAIENKLENKQENLEKAEKAVNFKFKVKTQVKAGPVSNKEWQE